MWLFVCGLNVESIKKQLLTKTTLIIKTAVKFALSRLRKRYCLLYLAFINFINFGMLETFFWLTDHKPLVHVAIFHPSKG